MLDEADELLLAAVGVANAPAPPPPAAAAADGVVVVAVAIATVGVVAAVPDDAAVAESLVRSLDTVELLRIESQYGTYICSLWLWLDSNFNCRMDEGEAQVQSQQTITSNTVIKQ